MLESVVVRVTLLCISSLTGKPSRWLRAQTVVIQWFYAVTYYNIAVFTIGLLVTL